MDETPPTPRTRWQIFVVAHRGVPSQFFRRDPGFTSSTYTMLNVGATVDKLGENFPTINQTELKNYSPLGPQWAESEAILNIFRSGLHKKLDYIGFLQYDKELVFKNWWRRSMVNRRGVTASINRRVAKMSALHISFETASFQWDYRQKIMADFARPDSLTGDGLNCYDKILEDLNLYLGSNFEISDLLGRGKVNLCSCFLVDRGTFEGMMSFFEWVVNTRNLDILDSERRFRIQGGLAERYFGVFLALQGPGMIDYDLPHHDLKALTW